MDNIADLMWCAGFLEADGSFHTSKNTPYCAGYQVNTWPLEKLEKVLGGTVRGPYSNERGRARPGKAKPIYYWQLGGQPAVDTMKRLYPFLSPRRQEKIDVVIDKWESRPLTGKRITHCPYGHEYSDQNTYLYRGSRMCRQCRTRRSAEQAVKKRILPDQRKVE